MAAHRNTRPASPARRFRPFQRATFDATRSTGRGSHPLVHVAAVLLLALPLVLLALAPGREGSVFRADARPAAQDPTEPSPSEDGLPAAEVVLEEPTATAALEPTATASLEPTATATLDPTATPPLTATIRPTATVAATRSSRGAAVAAVAAVAARAPSPSATAEPQQVSALAVMSTTISYSVTSQNGPFPLTRPLLPNRSILPSTTPVTNGDNYRWFFYSQPNCGGSPVTSSAQNPQNFSVSAPGSYSVAVRIYASPLEALLNVNRLGDSGCKALTVQLGTAEIVYSDPVAYHGNGVADPFSVMVRQVAATNSPVGPPPAGQLRIFLCPTSRYASPADCAASPPTASAGTYTVQNGTAVTGSIGMATPSYVLTRYDSGALVQYASPVNLVSSEGLAPSASPSPSVSPPSSISPSPSVLPSPSRSPSDAGSPSASPSISASVSPVPSPSQSSSPSPSPSPTVTVSLSATALDLGSLRPTCDNVPTGAACTASADGAFYVYSGRITVTVTSTAGWSGGCARQPQTELSATPERLMIRMSDGGAWTPIPIGNGSATLDPGCFDRFPAGTSTTYVFDIGVTVSWDDPPGALGDTVVFEVRAF